MTPEYEIHSGSRRCVVSDLVLRPTDHYFSALREKNGRWVRDDYSRDAWQGPPPEAFAWWESKPSDANGSGRAMAPNDVLLKLFDQWADDPTQAEARFVLTLLLVRRRVMRIEHAEGPLVVLSEPDKPAAAKLLRVYCPRRDEAYEVPELSPDALRAAEIQQQLTSLLAA
jgi:hypothetical protein